MAGKKQDLIVFFLGNPLMGDDSIGLRIGGMLEERLRRLGVEVVVTSESGLSLIDHMHGRDTAIIVDAVSTGSKPGRIHIYDLSDSRAGGIMAPHYMGIPEVVKLMRSLGLSPPKKIILIGIEIAEPYVVSDSLTPIMKEKLPRLVERVYVEIARLIREN